MGQPSGIDNWIIEPASRIQAIVREAAYAGVVPKALTIAGGFRNYLTIAREWTKEHGYDHPGFEFLAAQQDAIEFGLQELIDKETGQVPIVYKHSSLSLWVVVEVTIEDTIVASLTRSRLAVRRLVEFGVPRVPESGSRVLSEEEAREVVHSLERKVAQKKDRNAADRFPWMLQALGIPFSPNPLTQEVISKLCTVRNCFVHRGGIVDQRTFSALQEDELRLGDELRIDEQRWNLFYSAVGNYVADLMRACIRSVYAHFEDPETGEVLDGTHFEERRIAPRSPGAD